MRRLPRRRRPALRRRPRLRSLRRTLTRLLSSLLRGWNNHRALLLTNTAYAAALAATAAALAVQTNVRDLLSVLAAGVLAVYRALTQHHHTRAIHLPAPDEGDHA